MSGGGGSVSGCEQMARDEATRVVSDSTRAAIEKMAEEFARDMLKDPEFRQYLRDEATKAAPPQSRPGRRRPKASAPPRAATIERKEARRRLASSRASRNGHQVPRVYVS